jgi:Uma2 family endonuclease
MSRKTLLTADELELMPDDDSVQIELDEGELIAMPPAGEEHGDCETDIILILGGFVKQHGLGRVYPGDAGFRLKDDTVRVPDIAFVRQERVEAIRGKGFAKGAPDLAVEIFSPSDNVRQLMRKVKQYFAAAATLSGSSIRIARKYRYSKRPARIVCSRATIPSKRRSFFPAFPPASTASSSSYLTQLGTT